MQSANQVVTRTDDNLHRQASFMTRRRLRKENELVQALREDISDWIAKLFPHQSIQTDNFHDVIANGTILCQLARLIEEAQAKLGEKIDKNFKIQINKMTSLGGESLMKFRARENALSFIRWCQNRGINKSVMFEPDDLVEQRDQRQVIICLMEVSRYGVRYGIQPCKLVQFEMEIDAIEKQERENMQTPGQPTHRQRRNHQHHLNTQVSTAQERNDHYDQGRRKLTKIRKRRSKKGARSVNRDGDKKRNQLKSLHNPQSVPGNETSSQEKMEISVIYTQTSMVKEDKLKQSNARDTAQEKIFTEPSEAIPINKSNKSIDLHDIFAKNMKSAFGIAASPIDHDNPIQKAQNDDDQATSQSCDRSNQPYVTNPRYDNQVTPISKHIDPVSNQSHVTNPRHDKQAIPISKHIDPVSNQSHVTNPRHDNQATPISKHIDPVTPELDYRSHPLGSTNDNPSKVIESTPKSNNPVPNVANNPNVSYSNDYSKHQSFVSNAYPAANYSYDLSRNQSIQEDNEEEYWDDDEIDQQLSNLPVTKESSRENTPEADQTTPQMTLNDSTDHPSIDIPTESNAINEDISTSDVVDYSLLDINRERKRSTGEDSFIFDEEMMQREACIASDAVLDQYQSNQQHQQQSRLPYPVQNRITNQGRMYANKAASLDDDDDDTYEDEYEYEEEAENDDYYDEDEEEEEIVPLPSVLHKNVCKIINAVRANDDIVQMKEGKYKIFDKVIFVRMLNEHVMVRVGGGWDTLEHYITFHMALRKNKTISRSVDDVRSDIKANTSLTSYTRPKRTSIGGSVGNRDQLQHARSSSSLNSSGSFSGFQSRLKF